MPYEFDRYVGHRLMAQGARILNAASEAEAVEKARQLFAPDASVGEMARTTFVLRDRGRQQ